MTLCHGMPEGMAQPSFGTRLIHTGHEENAVPRPLCQPIEGAIGMCQSRWHVFTQICGSALRGFFLGFLPAAATAIDDRRQTALLLVGHQRAQGGESNATCSAALGQWFT